MDPLGYDIINIHPAVFTTKNGAKPHISNHNLMIDHHRVQFHSHPVFLAKEIRAETLETKKKYGGRLPGFQLSLYKIPRYHRMIYLDVPAEVRIND